MIWRQSSNFILEPVFNNQYLLLTKQIREFAPENSRPKISLQLTSAMFFSNLVCFRNIFLNVAILVS